MFDDVFVSELPEDVLESAVAVCDRFFKVHKSFGGNKKQIANIESYFKSLAFAEVFIEARRINYGPIPHIESNKKDFEEAAIKKVCDFFVDWQNECSKMQHAVNLENTFTSAKEEYSSMLGKAIAYEFSAEDYNKVQSLLKTIMDDLSASNAFESGCKGRLLNKFGRLGKIISPRMYHFDGFWGMVVDIWILLGKNQSAAKPLAKNAQQIADIVWAVQCSSEDIKKKSPVTLLPESRKTVLAK